MQNIVVKDSTNLQKDCVIYITIDGLLQIAALFELKPYSKLFIVTDEANKRLRLDKLMAVLPKKPSHVVLPSGDKYKSIQSVEKIWQAMLDANCDRKSLVINLGGGVIGDMGGFAASTYMRGIDFINIPTTLLAQVDASVGGKNGINFAGIKNLIGTINQPLGVVIDPQLLNSLPETELIAGFAEVIKHGLIWDNDYFYQVTAKKPADFSAVELVDIIARSCQIKADIIQDDIKETGKRKLVNFGHTVGHALETLSFESGQSLLHGEAISIGMMIEADISYRLNLISAKELRQIKLALENAGLPIRFKNIEIETIIQKMKVDKKNEGARVNFTLLDGIGGASFNQQVPEAVVVDALKAASL